jgi:hypothetical protein
VAIVGFDYFIIDNKKRETAVGYIARPNSFGFNVLTPESVLLKE